MKKIAIVIVFGLLMVPSLYGAERPNKKHHFEIGGEIYDYSYKEPGVMENDGVMYGIAASYAFHNKWMFKLEAHLALGEMDYDSVTTGSQSGVDDIVFEGRALGGIDFLVKNVTLTPFIGFGYRYLNDDSSGTSTTTGALGYERESQYYYAPLGLEASRTLGKVWTVGAALEYDFFLSGEQQSHLGDALPGLGTLRNDQDDGYGMRFSVFLQRQTHIGRFMIEGFFRYWKIDNSDISPLRYNGVQVGYGWEPENETRETGLKVSILF